MDSATFERLIKDMCGAAGLADWQEVARSGHLALGDRVIGLKHCAHDIHDDVLSVYVEFEPAGRDDLQLCGRLLQENLRSGASLPGFFGVHPDNGNVVYCVRMAGARLIGGADLAAFVEAQVRAAGDLLKTLSYCTPGAQHVS
ncbi:MAG: hypothetical protein H7346_22565 [Burkholderiaceae bacterium]|nr:hypothetical protein [Burkholderiaceae bacterium]